MPPLRWSPVTRCSSRQAIAPAARSSICLPDGKHTVAWTSHEIGTHFNTAVRKDGYLYAFDGRNEPDASLVCVELKTGKVMWREVTEWEKPFV